MASKSSKLSLLQRRWRNLLAWLENHGFQAGGIPVECREMPYAGNGLFACTVCMPGSLLFVVPPTVLMNKMTLKQHYPPNVRADESLTAVQFISMHLFVWRPKVDEDSADPAFGPYISILPKDFDSHPLTWLVLSKLDKANNLRKSLLDSLPPSVLTALCCLHARFWDDWCKVLTFLVAVPSIGPQVPISSNSLEALNVVMDFLWAWLIVNTRCMYYRLRRTRTDPDNVTLCPILDFANHTPCLAHLTPVPSNSEIWDTGPVNPTGDGLKFVSSDNVKIEENDEILLTYGSHSNKTLFVEYGFVNLFSEKIPLSGEVDIQDLAEKYLLEDVQLGGAVRTVLITEGYWGDWTLYSTADGAQPSWRLIAALRLYHLVMVVGSADEGAIQPWRDVVAGKHYQVSCENEQSWRKSVVFLCDTLIGRAERSIANNYVQCKDGKDDWTGWMSGNIRALWQEELFVARAVKECILRGDEF